MEAFFKDLKHSLRMFAQSPAFTLAAVAALTLGIGANTAIFSVVNAVLLKPVGVPDADRVVVFMNVSPRGSGPAAWIVNGWLSFSAQNAKKQTHATPGAAAAGQRIRSIE